LFRLFHPTFFSLGNVTSILSNVGVVAIISIAMTMVIVTGGIDVSVGSLLALCMLMSAKVMAAGVNSLLIALLVSLGVGLLIGALLIMGGEGAILDVVLAALIVIFLYNGLGLQLSTQAGVWQPFALGVLLIEPPPAETPVIHAGEEAGVPFLGRGTGDNICSLPLPFCFGDSLTNQERNATQVRTRQALTFAACVSRLFVR
jgi:predicted ABC-type sugar transport system permease subunit